MMGVSSFGRAASVNSSLLDNASAITCRTLSSCSPGSACSLCFTSRAAHPAVLRPSSNFNASIPVRTAASCSAFRTLAMQSIIPALQFYITTIQNHRGCRGFFPIPQKARVQVKEGGVRQFKPKLWLGIGVVALAGSAATHAVEFDQSSPSQGPAGKGGTITLAEARGAGGEGGEAGAQRPRTTKSKDQTRKPVSGAKPKRGAGGEGGEGGEGGARQPKQGRGRGRGG